MIPPESSPLSNFRGALKRYGHHLLEFYRKSGPASSAVWLHAEAIGGEGSSWGHRGTRTADGELPGEIPIDEALHQYGDEAAKK